MTALGNEFDHFSSLPHRKTKIASEAVQSDYSIIMILLHYDKKKLVCLEFSDGLERFKCSNQVFLVALYRNQTLIYAAFSTVHILHF